MKENKRKAKAAIRRILGLLIIGLICTLLVMALCELCDIIKR